MADVNANIGVNIDTSAALAQLKDLQRQISLFHSSISKSSEAAALAQRDLQRNFLNSVNAIGAFSAELRTVKTTAESFTSSLEKNKFSMREYFRYAGASTKTFGRLFKSEYDTIGKVAEDRVKKLQTQYIKMGRDASGAMKAIAIIPNALDMESLATQTQIAAQKQALFNQLMKQGSTNLLNFGKNTQWAGRQLMVGFTLPLMAAGSAASKSFMQMEAQALKFKKVYGDLFTPQAETEQALEDIKNLAKEFTKYGIAVSDTVGLAADAAAAGFAGIDLQRQTTEATRLSVLGQIDNQQALSTTIALQNAFGISSAELADNINFLNAVENQTVVSLDDITTAIPKVAPVIQQLGGDVKDLAFFMTAMKEGGINASEGANALKSGLASLINPSTRAREMLSGLGVDINAIVNNNKGDLKATVIGFAQALDTLAPLERARAIEQMFGKFQFARLSALFANVTKDGTQASRVLKLAGASIEELSSLSEQELGKTADSSMNKFKKSVEDLKAAIVPVGEAFLKTVTPIIDVITSIAEKFSNLSDGTKKAITVMVTVIGGLGPILLMTFGLLANGVANIIKLFLTLRNGYLRLTGQSQNLGEQTQYLTSEQIDAAAAAHSLNQAHATLTQQFTVETTALGKLIAAYQAATAAAARFAGANPGMMVAPPITKKYASGVVSVPGPKGAGDIIPAMLSPGEAVIPAAMAKKYAPLINGMIAGNIPGYSLGKYGADAIGPDGKPAEWGHISLRMISSVDEILAELLALPEEIRKRRQATIYKLQDIQALGGGQEEVNSYTSLATQQSRTLNEAIGKGKSSVPVQTFLDDFDHFGPGMFIPALQDGGSSLQEVGSELDNYHAALRQGIIAQGDLNGNQTVTGEQYAAIEKELRSTLPATSKLRIALDKAEAKIDELRVNLSTGFVDKVKAERPDLVVDEGTTHESILVTGATGKPASTKFRVKGNPLRLKDILGRQAMLEESQALGLESQSSAPQPFANSPQFERKVDLSGPAQSAARSSGSYRRTHNLIMERIQRDAELTAQKAVEATAKGAGTASPSKKTIPIGEDIARGLEVGMDNRKDDVARAGENLAAGAVAGTRTRRVASRPAGAPGAPVIENMVAAGSPRTRRAATRPQGSSDVATAVLRSKQQAEIAAERKIQADAAKAQYQAMRAQEEASRKLVIAAEKEELARKASALKMNKLNGALQSGSFALMSLSGVASMFGGKFSGLSNIIFAASGAMFAFQTIVQLATQAKLLNTVATKANTVAQLMGATSFKGLFAGVSGLLPKIKIFSQFLVKAITSMPGWGKLLAGALLVGGGLFKYYKIQQAAQERMESFSRALITTTDQLKSLGEYFGKTPTISALQRETGFAPGTAAQISEVDKFRESESFKKYGAPTVKAINNLSDKEATQVLNAKMFELLGAGFSKNEIQIIIESIQREAKRTNLEIDFKNINLDKLPSDILKDFEKQSKNIKDGILDTLYFTKRDREKALIPFKSAAGLVNKYLNGISSAFISSQIDGKQFTAMFDSLSTSLAKMPNQKEAFTILNLAIKKMDPALAKAAGGVKNLEVKMLLLKAAALGLGDEITKSMVKAAAYTGPDLILQDIAQRSQKEIDKITAERLAGLMEAQKAEKDLLSKERSGSDSKTLSAEAKLTIARLQKELDGLKTKRDLINETNDALKRQYEHQQKLMELSQEATQAKISGDYIGAALIGQQKSLLSKEFKQETESIALEKKITRLENRISALQSSAKVTAAEKKLNELTGKRRAMGGMINGPGSATSDSIPAMLSDGEYVIRASAVKQYGQGLFDQLNAQKFAGGGLVNLPGSFDKVKDKIKSDLLTNLKLSPNQVKQKRRDETQEFLNKILKSLGFADGGLVAGKKDGWLQRWAKSISGQKGSEMMGTAQLLRMVAGIGQKGDKLGAAQVPMSFIGSGLGPKVAGNLGKLAFALPNKLYQMKNQAKVNEMIKRGMWHGSQPQGSRGEEFLQGTNILDGPESRDPYYGMGFFGTSSKGEADLYASGYNSSSNWGESFGSMNNIVGAPKGKYIDFTRGTNSLKWQDYELSKALGVKRNGYIGDYMTEKLGDIMSSQGMTGAIMNRVNAGYVPKDIAGAKWLAWNNPAGVITKEKFAMGGIAKKYSVPSYDVGVDYVPADTLAMVHKGERVLTAEENKAFNGGTSVNNTNNIYINGTDLNKREIAEEVMVRLERAQKINNKSNKVAF